VISRLPAFCPVRERVAALWEQAMGSNSATVRTPSHGRCRIMLAPGRNATARVD
jgi:hypothetical protein